MHATKESSTERPSEPTGTIHSQQIMGAARKRAGTEDATRALFAAAVKEDRSDATAWMQWGQWEKRMQGPEIARDMFRNGLKSGTTRLSGFLYQAWALLEQESGNDDALENCLPMGAKRAVILPNSGTATLRLRRIVVTILVLLKLFPKLNPMVSPRTNLSCNSRLICYG